MSIEKEKQKVYMVLYNAHEYDDMDEGKDDIVFISLNHDNARKFYDESVKEISSKRPIFSFGEYEVDEDNTDTEFTCWWGKWCYTYKFVERELND